MRRVVALLAAVLAASVLVACGDDGAEPGAPRGATLVLDFQPNAVHAGLYAALERGYFSDEGLDLEIQEPAGTADGAKLLAAGRADFAILDINDFGIARERGLDIVAIAAVVQRPLASVIAADRDEISTPADLAGKTIGVTGVPSDDAVLDTILAEGGVDPNSVERQTIGFESVPLLAAGKIDAATAFWNAEGVDLKRMGIPTREFRVDEFGAPRYPELVVATTRDAFNQRQLVCRFQDGLSAGYDDLEQDSSGVLDELLGAIPSADRETQTAQLDALVASRAFYPPSKPNTDADQHPSMRFTKFPAIQQWVGWAKQGGLIDDHRSLFKAFGGPACHSPTGSD